MNISRDYLAELLRSKETVFTTKDAALLWKEGDPTSIKQRLYRYAKAGKLFRIRGGIYAKDDQYNKYELATNIYTPAYISFETVLRNEGIIFQYYSQTFVASYIKRDLVIGANTYVYKSVPRRVLLNPAGIHSGETYAIASAERAFLDTLYVYKSYFFDNLRSINWDKVYELLPLYESPRLTKEVREQQQDAATRY